MPKAKNIKNQKVNSPKEKRHHTRTNPDWRITLESLQFGVDENVRMANCSDGGLYFESCQVLHPGSDIFIRIKDYPDDRSKSQKTHHAKVIWGKRLFDSDFGYGYGVEYVVPSQNANSQDKFAGEKKELRKYPRVRCDKPANIHLDNKSHKGTISNISRNGCFIENNLILNLRQILDLAIPGTKFSGLETLEVEVVRLSPVGVGVKYRRKIQKLSTD